MIRKPFSRALYEAYDKQARDALVAYLQAKGHVIVSNEENYNVDVVSQKGGFTYFNEAEVKTAWKGDWNTAWTEIRLPGRKQRLLDKHSSVDGVLNFYIFRLQASMEDQGYPANTGQSQGSQGPIHPEG